MVRNLGKTFFRILGWTFLGDVLEKCLNDLFTFFQKMVGNLGKPFFRILGWTFLGDVLNNPFWQISARWSRIVTGKIFRAMVKKVANLFAKNYFP